MLEVMQSTTNLIGTEAVAAIFGVDRSTVTRWVQAGKLTPAINAGNLFLFDPEEIDALAEEQAS